jgi:flavin reductase (DIM6/NTAB) family NADH-FMN oxidoreductase RutF
VLYDPRQMETNDVYHLLIGLVIPRPIAFISTRGPLGRANLAPFSYFVPISSRPPLVGVSFTERRDDPKDTLRNIRDTGEYVINVVSEPLLEPMVKTAGEWPAEVSEFEIAGLTPRPSRVVTAPGVAESPVHLECRREREITLGNGTFVIGEIVAIDVDDAMFTEGRVDAAKLKSVGRLSGELYSLMREIVRVPRPRIDRRTGTPLPPRAGGAAGHTGGGGAGG